MASTDTTRQYKLYLREDLAKRVDLLLADPANPGRIKYGALKTYLEGLIAKDLAGRSTLGEDLLAELQMNFTDLMGVLDVE